MMRYSKQKISSLSHEPLSITYRAADHGSYLSFFAAHDVISRLKKIVVSLKKKKKASNAE